MIVHVLHEGRALCGTMSNTPNSWPDDHGWIARDDRDNLARERESGRLCRGCLVVTEGRVTRLPVTIGLRFELKTSLTPYDAHLLMRKTFVEALAYFHACGRTGRGIEADLVESLLDGETPSGDSWWRIRYTDRSSPRPPESFVLQARNTAHALEVFREKFGIVEDERWRIVDVTPDEDPYADDPRDQAVWERLGKPKIDASRDEPTKPTLSTVDAGAMDTWPGEIRTIADQLNDLLAPSYPGEAAPIDFLKSVADWLERHASENRNARAALEKYIRGWVQGAHGPSDHVGAGPVTSDPRGYSAGQRAYNYAMGVEAGRLGIEKT